MIDIVISFGTGFLIGCITGMCLMVIIIAGRED